MSENINTEASQKFPMMPVAPLGIIAMRGCEEMGKAVNDYLVAGGQQYRRKAAQLLRL